jgi:hypothetical protein
MGGWYFMALRDHKFHHLLVDVLVIAAAGDRTRKINIHEKMILPSPNFTRSIEIQRC